jgi:hypothetical protein
MSEELLKKILGYGFCAAEAAFLSYTAENSHHLKARIISKKKRCFNRRKYQQENGSN